MATEWVLDDGIFCVVFEKLQNRAIKNNVGGNAGCYCKRLGMMILGQVNPYLMPGSGRP